MIAMKIMIVEDEENIRDGIRNLVDWNQEGFEEPLLFSSAVEALVFLETETVDVVLTDLYMPVLNGIEFIRMLREQNQVCEVIILTGHERFELAREAIALGVKQYLLKPVTGQTLLTELHKVSREIQERMRLKDWVDIAKKKLHDYLPVIQNQFWNDLLLGNLIELKKIKERAHSGVGNDLPCGAKEGGTAGKRQDHQRNGASGTYRRNIRGKIFGCSFL